MQGICAYILGISPQGSIRSTLEILHRGGEEDMGVTINPLVIRKPCVAKEKVVSCYI